MSGGSTTFPYDRSQEISTLLEEGNAQTTVPQRSRCGWLAGAVFFCALIACALRQLIPAETLKQRKNETVDTSRDAAQDVVAQSEYADKSISSYVGVPGGARSGESRLQILILGNPAPLSLQRVKHLFKSLTPELICIARVVPGLDCKSFSSIQDMAYHDHPAFMNLTSEQKGEVMDSIRTFAPGSVEHQPQYYNGGSLACALGHLAMWERASHFDGWTIALEDDAVLKSGNWTVDGLVRRIEEDNQPSGITFLEARPCTRGYGLTAYAMNQSTAAELTVSWHFQSKVDIWLVGGENKKNSSGQLTRPVVCQRPVAEYTFHGWGVNEDPASWADENSLPSQRIDECKDLPLRPLSDKKNA